MNENTHPLEKRWVIRYQPTGQAQTAAARIAEELGIPPIVGQLLYGRGYTDAASARSFLRMESEMLVSPFEMRDMEQGIARIHRAVQAGEAITVFGDYDVDGVTAVSTLYLYLRALGARVSYYVPKRLGEGYGVSCAAIDLLHERGTSLIVTVDTGITANREVAYAATLGMDFVITDHHECHGELPPAVAVINPHRPDCSYPFKDLAGVGVIFKVICAYEERYVTGSRRQATERLFAAYADLVAIGTIADVMPIGGENRIMVGYGLQLLQHTERPGIAALIAAASVKQDGRRQERYRRRPSVTSSFIGFTLAPRINAAGRIRTADVAVELFLADGEERAAEIADALCLANKERQAEENKITREAYRKIEEDHYDDMPVIVLDADGWHHGVIGIVASRITERYGKPSILISFDVGEAGASPDDVGKGSGRSVKGLNLVDALCYCQEQLIRFGGHELAAGLSVTRGQLPAFRQRINEYAVNNMRPEDCQLTVEADVEVTVPELSLELATALSLLEPFGVGNPVPLFVMRDVVLAELSGVSEGKHSRLTLTDGVHSVGAMYFSAAPASLGVYVGDRVDVLFQLDVNEWMGRRTVQLIVRDVRRTEQQQTARLREEDRFAQIWAGAPFTAEEDVLPGREDFAAVYRLIVAATRGGESTLSHREICSRLANRPPVYGEGYHVGYLKLKVIIKVLCELNLLGIRETSPELYCFTVRYTQEKTDLERSGLLRRLRSQQKG